MIVDCEHKTAPTQADGYPSIRTPNIGRGYFLLDNVNRVSEQTYQAWTKRAVPKAGDLIMAREAPVGNVAMVPTGLQPCLGQRTLLIRPDHRRVHAPFLTYLLVGPQMQATIHAKTNGATVAHLNMKDVRELELPKLPPLGDQRRIAGILEAYDDLIENCERRIRVLDEMARTLYREWCVLFRYPGHEQVPLVDSPLGRIPKGWRAGTIADAAESVTYGYTTKASLDFEGPRFLRITDIVPLLIEWDRVPRCQQTTGLLDRYGLVAGDIVVARSGTVGVAKRIHRVREPLVFASYLVRIRVDDELASSFALGILMQSIEYRSFVERHAGGVAQPNAAAPILTSMPIAIPPRALSKRFDQLAEPLADQLDVLAAEIRSLRRTRDLLLPRLLSGQLSVEDA